MRPLSPRHVLGTRVIVLWALRVVSVVLVAVGLYLVIKRVLFAFISGMGFMNMLTTWEGVGEEHSLYRGLAFMAVGGTLAAISGVLAIWIIPAMAYMCPKCGYEPPTRDDPSRCPECGLDGVFSTEEREP
ncbi:MAG: hypothetical protein HBSAPP03_24170 [Phycisphaerae bacterium]|nr:MAG: hypothetical protein HBSAPP03_24170 [Phycisphaerae bacterium]